MTLLSRKTSSNILLLVANLILLAIIGQIVTANETTNAILEQSIYLYYYESDDALLDVGETQLYTFAPYPGENITIVSYGLDETGIATVSLYDSSGDLVETASSNQVTEPNTRNQADDPEQSPYVTAIQHTATSGGLYYFEVTNESGKEGLIRSMLFVGEPFNDDLTLIDELNPLLPSKAFMVAGDPNREWENELTGETIQGLRTEVDVQQIERIDRAPDVFTSYSTLSYLPDVEERLQPDNFFRWFNEDDEEIYLVNVRPLPEQETDASRNILANLDYQTYNSNNFFFFEYFFTVGNGSDPIVLDRGAGACAGLADRIDCVASDPNLGRDGGDSLEAAAPSVAGELSGELTIQGEVVSVSLDLTQTCSSFAGTGNPVTIATDGGATVTTECLPSAFVPTSGVLTTTGVTSISGTVGNQQNRCEGTAGNDIIACTTDSDWIEALGGNDAIFADAGDDDIFGGAGNDFILGGAGNDSIEGGSGNDSIDGGADNDIINLGGGSNLVVGNTGEDTIIIDGDHTSGDLSSLSGGSNFTTADAIDNEQDIFKFNDNAGGTFYLYTDSSDALDFEDYGSGVTFAADDYFLTSNLAAGVFGGQIFTTISGSNYDDAFNLTGCVFYFASDCGATRDYTVNANGGDDTVTTSGGNDTVNGGDGNDTISTGSGNDIIDGGNNDDRISSGSGNDTVNGGDGNDVIAPGQGTDTVDGGNGANTLTYQNLTTSGVIVTTSGTSGGVSGTSVSDTYSNISAVSGTDLFDDTFYGDVTDNTFDGLGGTGDVIDYSGEADSVNVDLSNESATGTTIGTDTLINIESIVGTIYDDVLIGSDSSNIIQALAGDDLIDDGAGVDTVFADAGNDTVLASAGNDILDGGSGTDDLIDYSSGTATVVVDLSGFFFINTSAEFGNDVLTNFENISGGSGNDTLLGDSDTNDITGGAGNDLIGGLWGEDTIFGEDGDDIIYGGDSSFFGDSADYISGGIGADTIYGEGGDDIIDGDEGADTLYGGDGNETLDGGEGIDSLNGGIGDDTLTGGDGDDVINGGTGTDLIDESDATTAIDVVLNGSSAGSIDDSGEIDTVFNVENVNTGTGDDTFTINDGNNNIINAATGTDVATVTNGSGTITILRGTIGTGPDVTVEDTGGGIGVDTYIDVEQVNVSGSATNDTFVVTDANDNIFDGGDGDDTIDYDANSDPIIVEFNSALSASITGTGLGNDTLINFESIATDIGDDVFTFGADAGTVELIGDSGNDTFDFDAGAEGTLTLTDTDTGTFLDFSGYDEAATLNLGSTSIQEIGTNLSATLSGSTIFTSVSGSNQGDTFTGTAIADMIYGGGDNDTINGSGGADQLFGEAGQDTINGGTGADTISGGADADTLSGDAGNDTIDGDEGNDTINGGANNDLLRGEDGNDSIVGDAGNDTLEGGAGDDTLDGGADIDTIDESDQTANLTLTLGDLTGSLTGGGDTDTILNVENVTTGSGDDTLNIGDSDDNIIDGSDGTDTVTVEGSGTVDIVRVGTTVTATGTGIGTDTFINTEVLSFLGTSGNETVNITDETNNIVDGNGGTDTVNTVNNSTSDDTITITRSGTDVTVDGTGIGTDDYNDIDFVNVTGGTGNETFELTDENDNTIDGSDGNDTVNTTSTDSSGGETITVARTGSDVNVTGSSADGIGNDDYNNVEEVNITASDGDDTFDIFDAFNNTFDGGDGNDTANYSSTPGSYTIVFDSSSQITVTGTNVGTDILLNIENVVTGSGDDNFDLTDPADNVIGGGAGTDTLTTNMSGTFSGVITIVRSGSDVTVTGSGYGTDTYLNMEKVNVNSNSGADVFRPTDSNDNDFDAGGGIDWIDYRFITGTSGVTVNLTTGLATGDGNDSLTNFENISGTDYADDLTGDGNANVIDGLDGVDTISGLGGNDTLDGGNGNDTLLGGVDDDIITGGLGNDDVDGGAGTDTFDESDATSDMTVTLGTGSGASIGQGTDSLTDIENVNTGSGNDTFFVGDSGDNTIDAGSETLEDVVTVTSGSGTITVTRSGADVTVADTGGGIGNDEYLDVEQVNVDGNTTNDTFIVSDANDNVFDGQGGTDSIDYSSAGEDITVDFTGPSTADVTGSGSSIGNDTLSNFEEISTGSGADTLIFDANVGTGLAVNSLGGDDIFEFGSAEGTLTLADSAGNTFLDFRNYTNTNGIVNLDLSNTSTSQDVSGDTLLNLTLNGTFNNVSGSDYNDTISGTTVADVIYGGTGVDSISGNSGADTLYGEDGADTLHGGADADLLYGGAANDTLYGDAGDDTLYGGLGDDTLYGGADTDTVDESSNNNDLVVTLNDPSTGSIVDATAGETDTIQEIENISTGGGDDTFFITDSDDNIIDAGSESTADIANVNGGSGTITITRSGADVDVDDTGGGIGTDQYLDVELINVSGSATNDTFVVSDGNNNELNGLGGSDTIDYSSSGEDITVDFTSASTADVTGSGSSIGNDTLMNFEEISTGSGADTLIFNADVGTGLTINSLGGNDVFDFDAAEGTLTLVDSAGSTFLDFSGYTNTGGVNLDLSDTVSSQDVSGGGDLNLTLNGTFNNVSGSAFVDDIAGTTSADVIYGGDGADTLSGSGGIDTLYGEAGDDTLNGGDDADILRGGADNDTLNGGDGDDTLEGGASDDTIDGGAGSDTIDESASTNDLAVTLNDPSTGSIVDATAGETDTVSNVENITTGSGNDTFDITDSDDNIIDGGSETTEDVATVSGGQGDITVTRSGADVDVSDTGGGIGTDQYLNIERINVNGSDSTNDNFIVDDSGDNEFDGLNGTDSISYTSVSSPISVTITAASAVVDGTGIGTDTLYNIEEIFTGTGDDVFDITGNPTTNYVLGANTGADIFLFRNSVQGTLTLDTDDSAHLDFSSFTGSGITIDLSDSTSQTIASSLDVTLTGTFDSISGTGDTDVITGTDGADMIWAGAGADTVNGGQGADIIYGEAGADTLNGDAGDDTLFGGAGNDEINGGADTDLIDESTNTDDITIVMDSTSGTIDSTSGGTDTITGIENINTGSGDDDITIGDAGDNTIDAGADTTGDVVTILNANVITIQRTGSDVAVISDTGGTVGADSYLNVEQVNIEGTGGDDVFTIDDTLDNIINGQTGTDEIDYTAVTQVINVNVLAASTSISSTGTGDDTLIDIENVTTGSGDDVFVIEENNFDNTFDAGADTGGDTTTVVAGGTVSATNTAGTVVIETSTDTDTLENFENVNYEGSTGDDTFIIQDTEDNTIDAGSETTATGDTYDANFATNSVTVTQTGAGSFTADGADVGTDTLIDFETVVTGDGDDIFIIDTDIGGTFFFDAGSVLGNTFEFTGSGAQPTNVTISTGTTDDTLDFSGFTGGGVDIDLSDTGNSQNIASNLTVTMNNMIANVVGTENDDNIQGNSLDNNISGAGGNDTVGYSTGNDVIDGGDGTDGIDYSTATTVVDPSSAITATLDSGGVSVEVSGTSDTQTVTSIEAITGTSNNDTIIVNDAVSTTIDAASGIDVVDYSGLGDAVNVNLETGTGSVSGTNPSDDHTLVDVEDVVGSNFDDTIVGNDENNTLEGGAGDDVLQGNGGDDNIDGGADTDTVSYTDAASGADVDLDSGNANDGDGGNDTLSNLENVSGSGFADNITGTDGENVIYGGDGDDTIIGLDGADTIYGGDGSDAISGSAGTDVIYGGNDNSGGGSADDTGNDTIYGGDDADTIYGGNNNTAGGSGNNTGTDTIYGEDGGDMIYGGNNNADEGSGSGTGNDTGNSNIDGGDGNDTLYGGNNNANGGDGDDGGSSDNDVDVDGGGDAPTDTIEGGNGNDTIFGGNNNSDGGSGRDDGDLITDSANGTANPDNDEIYGDNNNTNNNCSVSDCNIVGGDGIDVQEGESETDNLDTVYGDNKETGDQDPNDDIQKDGSSDTSPNDFDGDGNSP